MTHSAVEPGSDPADLERYYREDPEAFRAAFGEARKRHEDDLLLRFWEERLRHDGAAPVKTIPTREVVVVVLLALMAGTVAKVPDLLELAGLPGIDPAFYYERHVGYILLVPLAVLFARWYRPPRRLLAAVGIAAAAVLVFVDLLPAGPSAQDPSDTTTLAVLHLPFLLWGMAGVVFAGARWRTTAARLRYVTYTGEVLALTGLILIGGVLLTALTFLLFEVIGLDIEQVYGNWVVVYGAAAAPTVAALLVREREQLRLAPLIANTFAPLVLLTLVVFLSTMVILQKSLYTDRDFLLVFNVVLLLVLAIAVYSLSEHEEADSLSEHEEADVLRFRDYVNVSLLALGLVLNAVALSAIVFRLASYGLTPNRLAVLGTNLLVCVHLVWMTWSYARVMGARHARAEVAAEAMRYLPVYLAWVAFVVFAFPLLFGFA